MHLEARVIHDIAIDPDHAKRTESEEFRRSKERLRADGHYRCFICGSTENLQVHHLGVEWMFAPMADFTKMKEFLEAFDPYGYGRLLRNTPIESVDDIRNCLVLCQAHHTGVDHQDENSGTGIHDLTFPSWIAQLTAPGVIPQPGQTATDAEKVVEQDERTGSVQVEESPQNVAKSTTSD